MGGGGGGGGGGPGVGWGGGGGGGGGGGCIYAKVEGVSIKFFGGNTKRPCQDFVLVIEICRVRINS